MRNFLKNFQHFFQIFLKFYSKFISNFLRISFRIYLKSLKCFLKIFATFITENFPEICTNFSKNLLQKFVKIAVKYYLRIDQILHIVYPKFPENFLLFVDFPQIFITIFITSQNFHNQLIKVFCDCSSIIL